LEKDPLPSRDFDWQQLRQLAGEDSDFENELLSIFLQDAERSLKELADAIASNVPKSIEEAAHSLRGASANVGAKALANTARQLEQAARADNSSGAQALLQQLNSHYRRLQAQFQSKRG